MKIRLVYSKLLFHHIVEHLLSFQGRISHTFHQAAYLKSMFLAMLHIFADNQQSCVTNMIAVGMYRTNRLVEQFAGGTFGHIPFLHQKTGGSQETTSLHVLLFVGNPVKRFGRSLR